MKNVLSKALAALLILSFTVSFTSCKTTTTRYVKSTSVAKSSKKSLPPGQAKKINGDKSAKKYAPGQKRKEDKKRRALFTLAFFL